ncbi:MAG TPA: FAD-binding oxidoreductase, partial [Desulfobacteria bacterium]|nr:FAD-binding oxidoreductase [Desulfobacteria bacterium]
MDKTIKEALKAIVGEENFTDSLIDLIAYAKDASEHGHRPEAAVWPTRTEQVSAIMKLANRERFPVVPRGAGTSLAGLAVPEQGGLILDLGRMDKIVSINIEDR